MATGDTITGSLADSIQVVISSARVVRDFEGVMPRLVDNETLGKGDGLTWNEISLSHLTAVAITESTDLQNPRQFVDTKFSVVPTGVGIMTVITDRVGRRIASKTYKRLGGIAQRAIQRKKDEDGLTALAGATTTMGGSGTTLTTGHISAAARRITSNATEPYNGPIRAVLHGYQIRDIDVELTASVGTYPVTDGMTADVFKNNFRGKIGTAEVFEDGNISFTSGDATGGVFGQGALVLVEDGAVSHETQRLPNVGGGATALYLYDWYAYGERSSGNWLYKVITDATAPTS